MDDEVIKQARRQIAMLHSVGLPRAAAESEAAYLQFAREPEDEAPVPAA